MVEASYNNDAEIFHRKVSQLRIFLVYGMSVVALDIFLASIKLWISL